MKNFRMLRLATPMMIVCGLLATGVSAMAESDEGPCSNRSLSGDYGFTIEGVILAGPVTLPLRGVAMTTFRRQRQPDAGGPCRDQRRAASPGMDAGQRALYRQFELHWNSRYQRLWESAPDTAPRGS